MATTLDGSGTGRGAPRREREGAPFLYDTRTTGQGRRLVHIAAQLFNPQALHLELVLSSLAAQAVIFLCIQKDGKRKRRGEQEGQLGCALVRGT